MNDTDSTPIYPPSDSTTPWIASTEVRESNERLVKLLEQDRDVLRAALLELHDVIAVAGSAQNFRERGIVIDRIAAVVRSALGTEAAE